MKLDEVDKDPWRFWTAAVTAGSRAPGPRVAGCRHLSVRSGVGLFSRHASMIPARGTYVCAADTNMGLQLTGIFGYRLAGRSVGASPAILRWAIARATPIM